MAEHEQETKDAELDAIEENEKKLNVLRGWECLLGGAKPSYIFFVRIASRNLKMEHLLVLMEKLPILSEVFLLNGKMMDLCIAA